MAVRTTVDIPEPLHDRLRVRAERSGSSIRALIIRAIEQVYSENKKGDYVTGALVTGPGKLGPAFPEDENPHDLVFS
jgi:3-methyladenine DNA glycosylase Mpg